MLGIQNSLPVTNSVKFGQAVDSDTPRYDIPDYENDEFSKEAIEAEKNQKLQRIDEARANVDELADTLEANPDKMSKKAGKAVRIISGAIGLAGTFVMAKYGSKVTIGAFRNFAKSGTANGVVKGAKAAWAPIGKGLNTVKEAFSKAVSNPMVQAFKKSAMGKKVMAFAERPAVKSTLEKLQGYKEASKTLVKTINGDKVQNALENTMAASTTASVLIDDLAGRNTNKSNIDLAMGASGGDR